MQEIRDSILATLSSNFNAQQLKMIDMAVLKALKGKKIVVEETLPSVQKNGMVAEIEEYLARKKSKGLQEGTLEQYRMSLRYFALYCQKAVREVTEYDIIRFLDGYEQYRGVKRSRKNDMRVHLNTFFRYMSDTGRITSNPCATIEAIKFDKKVRMALTDLELDDLRRACKSSRSLALVDILFATGCRVSEVIRLNREDIDFERRQIKVFGKGSKERFVFLNAMAMNSLKRYFRDREDGNAALFVSERAPHQRVKKNTVENIIRNLGKEAGISKRVFPHLLRHTTATFLLRHKMPIDQVQMILGHESTETTLIYAKSDPEQIRAEYQRCMAA